MTDDLGDARSRAANARHRDLVDRSKAADPEYAYAPRWVPTSNWRVSPADILLFAFGASIILCAVAMHLLGYY